MGPARLPGVAEQHGSASWRWCAPCPRVPVTRGNVLDGLHGVNEAARHTAALERGSDGDLIQQYLGARRVELPQLVRPYEPDGLGIDVGDEEIAGGVGKEGLHGGSIRRAVEKRRGLGDEHLVTWTETDDLHWYRPPLSSLGKSKDTCAQQRGEPPPDGDVPGYRRTAGRSNVLIMERAMLPGVRNAGRWQLIRAIGMAATRGGPTQSCRSRSCSGYLQHP